MQFREFLIDVQKKNVRVLLINKGERARYDKFLTNFIKQEGKMTKILISDAAFTVDATLSSDKKFNGNVDSLIIKTDNKPEFDAEGKKEFQDQVRSYFDPKNGVRDRMLFLGALDFEGLVFDLKEAVDMGFTGHN